MAGRGRSLQTINSLACIHQPRPRKLNLVKLNQFRVSPALLSFLQSAHERCAMVASANIHRSHQSSDPHRPGSHHRVHNLAHTKITMKQANFLPSSPILYGNQFVSFTLHRFSAFQKKGFYQKISYCFNDSIQRIPTRVTLGKARLLDLFLTQAEKEDKIFVRDFKKLKLSFFSFLW